MKDSFVKNKAISEIQRDANISRIRGTTSGTWHCSLRKTNKWFLTRTITQTVNYNKRENDRHKNKSKIKLEQLNKERKQHAIDKSYIVKQKKAQTETKSERIHNQRIKASQLQDTQGIKFVKAQDLDERVLIPGQPKEAKVKKISFVTPRDFKDKFLGHDGRDLFMERMRRKIGIHNIPKKNFVPPESDDDKIFQLSQNKVAGLIRAVNHT